MAEYWKDHKSSSLPPSYYQYNRPNYYAGRQEEWTRKPRRKWLWQSVLAMGAFLAVISICTSEEPDLASAQTVLRQCFVADSDVTPVLAMFDGLDWSGAGDGQAVRANAALRINEEMALPAAGKVVGTFGWQGGAAGSFSPGITIETAADESVKAAYAGTVLMVQEGTDGYTVMLAHSNGLVTTYGHLRQVFVKADQLVEKGQVIATAGQVMKEKGELYFETKHLGEPVDPLTFLQDREI